MPTQYPKPIIQQPLDGQPTNYPFPPIPGLAKQSQQSSTPIQQRVIPSFSKPSTIPSTQPQSASSSTAYGVTRLSMVVMDEDKTTVVSQSFNNGKGDTQKKGKYYEEVKPDQIFNFAPGVDKPKICWKVRNITEFQKVTFELFCKGSAQAIWQQSWENDDLTKNINSEAINAGSKEKNGSTAPIQWNGSLDWEKTVRLDRTLKLNPTDTAPAFPDGVLTVQHSPYQLRMTIEGKPSSKSSGYPLIAWTYIHVLVDSISLDWGSDIFLAPSRPDIDPGYEAEVLGYEKVILQELQKKAAKPGAKNLTHEVLLTSNQFAHKPLAAMTVAEYEDKTDYEEYKKMWGDGPRIPLLAKVYLKTAAGKPTDKSPQALTGTRILWDWQDKAANRWKEYTADATYTTEDYIEALFQQQNPIAKPLGSSNCPSRFGGKLGNPQAHVFPVQDGSGPFPYIVEGCRHRTWAALSQLGTTPTTLDMTGVIFQPSRMAGDRYEVSACLYFDDAIDSDQDIQVNPLQVHAKAGRFDILRRINLTYLVRGTNVDLDCNPDDCVRAMKALYRKELSIEVEVDKVNVDNTVYQQAIANAIEYFLQNPLPDARLTGFPFVLRHILDSQPAPNSPGVCYVDHSKFLERLEDACKKGRLRPINLSNIIGKFDYGEEIVGNTSGARGVLLNFHEQNLDSGLLLLNNNNLNFSNSEPIRGRATGTTAIATSPVSPNVRRYSFGTFRDDQSAQYATANVVAFNNGQTGIVQTIVTVNYSKKKFTRSLKTKLSTQAQQDLKTAFIQAAQQVGEDGHLTIEVRGRQNSAHAQERIRVIKDYLQQLLDEFAVIDRSSVFQNLKTDQWAIAMNPTNFQYLVSKGQAKLHDILLPVIIKEYVALQYVGRKGLFILHSPGTNNLRDLAIGRGTYELLPVEGAYFSGYLSNERDRGLTYFATVDPTGQFVKKASSKSLMAVFSHELAHALFKSHAPSAVPGSFDAPNTVPQAHVARDNCLMNYDVNSEHFCGLCMVRSRGWEWNPTQANAIEMEYQITLELGDVNELFTYPASIEKGKMERLQVLGLFNNPLDHVDATDCFPFAWNHAVSLFPQLNAPNANLDTIFAQLIQDFLVKGAKLPATGKFAKIRIPGGHTPLYSSAFLEAKFTDEEQKTPEAKRFSKYMLEESKRYSVEQDFYNANPSLGKIPLVVKVRKRPKGSNLNWQQAPLAPEAQVYFQLVPADPLPAYVPITAPKTAKHSVAGGFSHYNQVVAPPLLATPQQYITTKVDQYQPNKNASDPHASNTHVDLGGKRGAANQDIFLSSKAQGWAALPAATVINNQHQNAVCVPTDENGEANIIFAPSRIGGDRYKIRAYVGPVTMDNDGTKPGDAVAETGTMVRWRAIRICRQVYMPPSPTEASLPNNLQNNGVAISPNIKPFIGQSLPELDLIGRITQEFAKSYCELILEPAALQREPIANHNQAILNQIAQLLQDYPDFNKPRRTDAVSPFRADLIPNAARTQFTVTLNATTPEPNSMTIRPEAGGIDSVMLSDEDSDSTQQGDIAMTAKSGVSATASVNYTTGEVKVNFPQPTNGDYQVTYYPNSYVDVATLLPNFPNQSPFLFNFSLPNDYNVQKGQGFLDFDVDAITGMPAQPSAFQPFQFTDAGKLGLVKGLLMNAVAKGIGNNNGFYPGLVIIQAISTDSYNALWGSPNQAGKGVGSGIFVFGNELGDLEKYHKLALHEMSHGLYFHHAEGGGAAGPKRNLHDSAERCLMSYDSSARNHCGQCVASLRGMNEWSKVLNDLNP